MLMYLNTKLISPDARLMATKTEKYLRRPGGSQETERKTKKYENNIE